MAVQSASLAPYRKKRDFSKTPEPKGSKGKQEGYHYLIQKHAARRLHYDLRLELDGVLKSWAVTRGPSLDPHDKRLAVEVEDHPVAYGSFEGIIPQGQYGGGTVMLWDEGSWEPLGDPHAGLTKGKLEFRLHGKRLTGEWTLVRMRDRKEDKGRHNWLLIKRSDEAARSGDHDALLGENMTSVVSGRTMNNIASAEDRVWQSNEASRPQVKNKSRLKGLPAFVPPQLATLTDSLPQGKDWVHEVKFDGYRALAYLQDHSARMYTRTGQDWTHKFPALAEVLVRFPAESAILDGEIIALNEQNTASFKALQNALSERHDEALQYYIFDLLFLDGENLMEQTLLKRKRELQSLLADIPEPEQVFYSEHFSADDRDLLERFCDLQLEGVVSKRIDSIYSSGRGRAWLKTKCHKRQEFVIGGFTLPTHAARGIGALLIGYWDKEKLVYAGKVGTGFDSKISLTLRGKLDALIQKSSAFDEIPVDGRRGAQWVRPELVCEIEFTEWTQGGRLRHPSFQGLREDKPARAIGRDIPFIAQQEKPPKARSEGKDKGKNATVGSITISHPDRIIYPGTSISKLQLAEYYLAVSDYLLPHVKNRPLSMIRCPEGIGEACFFQRHIAREQSPYLHNADIHIKGRDETYLMIKDRKGLITLAQWGVVELHPWGCTADSQDRPDRMIFDLDPDPALSWEYVIEGAREIRARMQEFGLESFVKTTGGKGLHVVIPMIRTYGWDTIKRFAQAIALSMQDNNRERYIAKASKAARKGKIFVDYLRNDLTSTAIAPFSARAREGAPVAMPVTWEALKPALRPQSFTIETVPEILRQKAVPWDPWADFFTIRQKISAKYLSALNIPY